MITIPSGVLDPAKPVGVHFLPASPSHPPLRIFYPMNDIPTSLDLDPAHEEVGWFDETGVVDYLEGYLHTMGLLQGDSWASRWIVKPWLSLVSLALPLKWLRLPGVFRDSPPQPGLHPLVIFSHGLTGTGQENAALCASWAQEGMVVVGVWHTDGSSSHVPLEDGTKKYYESPPPITKYDAHFRPKQVQQRADELFQARQFVLDTSDKSASPLLQRIRSIIDPHRVAVAGFSYGAATVALTLVQMTKRTDQESSNASPRLPFQAAILLDGWFHIDIQESAGIEFEFPLQAFEYIQDKGRRWPIPSLFLSSEQFQGYHKLFHATQKLASAAETQPIVLAGTGHQNFCDVVFWLPTSLLRRTMMGFVGEVDPLKAYQEMVERSKDFLKQHLRQERHASPTPQ